MPNPDGTRTDAEIFDAEQARAAEERLARNKAGLVKSYVEPVQKAIGPLGYNDRLAVAAAEDGARNTPSDGLDQPVIPAGNLGGTGPLNNEAYNQKLASTPLTPVSTSASQPGGPMASTVQNEAETPQDPSVGYDGSPIPLGTPRTGTSTGPGTKGLKSAWAAENATTLDAAQNQVTRSQTSAQKLEQQATEFQQQAEVAKTQAQKSQDVINQENQKWNKWAADWTSETEAARKDMEQQKIDPDRFWHSKSTASKIIIALSVAGEAMGSAWARTSGGNVLRTLDQHVNDDINAQMSAMSNKRASFQARQNMFGQQMQLHGDRVAAEEATRGFAWDQVAKMATVQSQLQATQEKRDSYGAIADQAKMKASESFTGYQTRLYTLAKQQAAASAASRAREQQFAVPLTNPDGTPVIGTDGRPVFRMSTPTKMQERNDKLAEQDARNGNLGGALRNHLQAQSMMKSNPRLSTADPELFQQALDTRALTKDVVKQIQAANGSAEIVDRLAATAKAYHALSPVEKLMPKGAALRNQYESHKEEYVGVLGRIAGGSDVSGREHARTLVPGLAHMGIGDAYTEGQIEGLWSALEANVHSNLGSYGIAVKKPNSLTNLLEGTHGGSDHAGNTERINVRTRDGKYGTISNSPEAKRMAEASGMTVL